MNSLEVLIEHGTGDLAPIQPCERVGIAKGFISRAGHVPNVLGPWSCSEGFFDELEIAHVIAP